MSSEEHEVVSIYPFTDAEREELLTKARECTFNWATKDGWPVGVIHAFVWRDGRGWITCGAHRHRVAAIKRDPRCSVVVSGMAAPNGPNGAVTFKGRAIIHEDEATKAWFYPALARGPYTGMGDELTPQQEAQAKAFEERLDSPLRVIIEIVPEKWIMLDSDKMAKDTAGELTEEERGPLLESDAKRMAKEIERRGLN
ncbi:MAG: pyridoxamine 5'-phosphate oxidase family protein [Pseudomonadota bacterium]